MTGVDTIIEAIKSNRYANGFAEDDFEIQEISAKPIFDNAPKPKPMVEIRFNPDLKTKYFEHIDGFDDDGFADTTTYFLGCLNRILNGLSLPEYNEDVAAAHKIRYTVGNFVMCVTQVNPILNHVDLYLPLKVDIIKGSRRWK